MMRSEAKPGGVVSTTPPKVLVLGVGNILLRDDGFGVHFINAIQGLDLPDNICVLEGGTVSHQLIPLFNEIDHLIVVDAVHSGDTPGSLFRFSPDDMTFPAGQKVSLHQMSLIDVLNMAALTGAAPKTIIVGVQPKDITSWSTELSPELKAVIPRVKDLMLEELKKIRAL